MVLKRKKLLTKTIPFVLLGLLAFVLYLVFFVNINEMIVIIKQASLQIILLAAIVTVIEIFSFTLAWYSFLKPLCSMISLKKSFMYVLASNFIDLLVPAESISGEISRVYFVTQDGVDPGKAAASVVTQRIFGMFLTIGTLALGAAYLLIFKIPFPSLIQSLILFVVAVTAIFLFLILVLCFKEKWTQKVIDKLIDFIEKISRRRWNLDVWRDNARKGVKAFYESLHAFKLKPLKLILPVIFSILSWFLGVSIYYLVFGAIGYVLNWAVLTIVYALVISLKSIPVGLPAEVGVTEIAMTMLFGAFGVPLHISAAATVLIRVLTVWLRFILGFGAIQWISIKTLLENKVFSGIK